MSARWRAPAVEEERRVLFNGSRSVGPNHPHFFPSANSAPPPSVRLGLLVASGSLGPSHPHTSDIRRSFAQMLGTGRMGALIADLTATEGRQWSAWDPRGRISFSAVLATGDDDPAPVAWARFTPADPAWAGYGRAEPRCAELTVYVQPRDERGRAAPSQGIPRWHRRFAASLDALAEFADRMLVGELRLEVTGDPAMKAAVWLEADPDLSELVDTTGARRLPGSMVRKDFGGYAVADPEGSSASELATGWVRQMCDDALHLDDYEALLITAAS